MPCLTFAAIDTGLFDSIAGFEQKLGHGEKHDLNPVMPRDAPWDFDANDHVFAQIVREPGNGQHHLWMSGGCVTKEGFAYNRSTYAVSRDGVRFGRPRVGRHAFDGSFDNSIWTTATWVEHTGIAGHFEDPHDPDPMRRYKHPYPAPGTITPHDGHPPRALCIATSPDRVHWTAAPGDPIQCQRGIADTFNHGWWDEDLKRYVIITRTHTDGMRSVGRVESPDFEHWSPIETVFVETDPGLTVRQYYAMPTWKYAGGYVGFLYIFHSEPTEQHGGDTPMDVELAWSADSFHWQPICKGQPLIPRGDDGAFDAGRICALLSPIEWPGVLRVYYGGVSLGKYRTFTLHEPVTSGVGLATFRQDGLVMQHAQGKATAVSRLETFTGRSLIMNADASRGGLRVALLDVLGRPIKHFSFENADSMTVDSTSHAMTWNHRCDLSALSGRKVRVAIEAENVDLYAYRFV